ncbi:hypothetical protein MMC07_007979 [Pseudocyphellaria aurata]|nr:hypothetical protein [Pseudocyphellaria aurata]
MYAQQRLEGVGHAAALNGVQVDVESVVDGVLVVEGEIVLVTVEVDFVGEGVLVADFEVVVLVTDFEVVVFVTDFEVVVFVTDFEVVVFITDVRQRHALESFWSVFGYAEQTDCLPAYVVAR